LPIDCSLTWSALRHVTSRLPSPKRSALCAVALGEVLYAIGGYDGHSNLCCVDRYDPRADSWTRVHDMVQCRSGHAAAVIAKQIYVIGGYDPNQDYESGASAERYDEGSDSWEVAGGSSIGCEYHSYGAVVAI
jgi:N-acetylneuraminic acid mutarotase